MRLGPTSNWSRIEVVDAVRGFALLGVLLANIPFDESTVSNEGWDTIFTFIYYVLIDKKFITIFSILFGFGFFIQFQRASQKDVDFTHYFIIRMLLLYAIGSIHAFVVWNGDILRAYAMGGIALLLVKDWPVKRLITTALLFNVFLAGIFFIGNDALGWRVYDYDYALAGERVYTASYSRYLVVNATMDPWINFFKDMPITLTFTFGSMLLGFVLGKVNFFTRFEQNRKKINLLIVLGATAGFASSFLLYLISTGKLDFGLPLIWLPFLIIAGLLLQSLMYIALVFKAFHLPWFSKAVHQFTYVGKTALSNYLIQSLLYLLVFFHCVPGIRLLGTLTMAQSFVFAILFFALQTVLSYLYLKHYSQGPIESIWKRTSYYFARPKSRLKQKFTDHRIQTSTK